MSSANLSFFICKKKKKKEMSKTLHNNMSWMYNPIKKTVIIITNQRYGRINSIKNENEVLFVLYYIYLIFCHRIYLIFCPQFLAQSSKNPRNFLSDRSVFCYANEMTYGGPLDSFRMEAGHQKDQTCNQMVEIWGQRDLHRVEGDWRLSLLMLSMI